MSGENSNPKTSAALLPPRFEQLAALRIAGLRANGLTSPQPAIGQLWRRFAPLLGDSPSWAGKTTYGVNLLSADRGFDYLAGVALLDDATLPVGLSLVSVPAQTYAVFTHAGHISEIRHTVEAIFSTWLPHSGYHFAQTGGDPVSFLEHYGEGFDPRSGLGDIEIQVPILV